MHHDLTGSWPPCAYHPGMASYDPEDRLTHPLDYRIAQQGGVALYWQPSVLNATISWLRDRGYRIAHMDTSSCTSELDVHRTFARALDFPSYFGENLDALADCLSDVAEADYGWSHAEAGLVMVIDRFDIVAGWDAEFAHRVLDVVASAIYEAALLGNRILCLAQTDDNRLRFDGRVGGSKVGWNDAEWSDVNRGLYSRWTNRRWWCCLRVHGGWLVDTLG
jgi:hypothetical protein